MRQMKSPSKIGAPQDSEKSTAFEQACCWLENEIEMKTIGDFCSKMRELSPKGETYTHKYVKSLLQTTYGSYLMINSMGNGKDDVIIFENVAEYLISEKFKVTDNVSSEKERMIKKFLKVI